MADPYGVNPIAEMLAERDPWRYEQLTKVSTPPKLFANGTSDVPAFTNSGVDPQALLKLPFGVRHAAAEERDITKVYALFEQYAGMPEMEIDSYGLQDAKLRAEHWMRDTDPRTPEQITADEAQADAEYEAYDRSFDRYGLTPEEHRQLSRSDLPERNARFEERRVEMQTAQREGRQPQRPEWSVLNGEPEEAQA